MNYLRYQGLSPWILNYVEDVRDLLKSGRITDFNHKKDVEVLLKVIDCLLGSDKEIISEK